MKGGGDVPVTVTVYAKDYTSVKIRWANVGFEYKNFLIEVDGRAVERVPAGTFILGTHTIGGLVPGQNYEIGFFGINENETRTLINTLTATTTPLITDRTQADVDFVYTLIQAIRTGIATSEQAAAFLEPQKGAYNYTDLNRVGAVINAINESLLAEGYGTEGLTMRTDWAEKDPFYPSDLAEYLNGVDELKNGIPLPSAAPETPNAFQPFSNANQIEEILLLVSEILEKMMKTYRYADTFFCGEDNHNGYSQ